VIVLQLLMGVARQAVATALVVYWRKRKVMHVKQGAGTAAMLHAVCLFKVSLVISFQYGNADTA
jgi:hypothetical protein